MDLKNKDNAMPMFLVITLAILLVFVVVFLVLAGLTYIVCLAFGMTFSWWYAIGIYAITLTLRIIFI